jgi:hypothetical protein
MRLGITLLGTTALAIATALAAPDARACGGCFPPPGDQQSVVTDHRMILSVSKQQTTLYDQIQYSGDPQSFAWVLPISGQVQIGLSADTLFAALHNLTATVVQAPPTRCPPPPNCNNEKAGFGGSGGADAGAPSAGGVDVLKQETVGPYETVQLRSTDPNALSTWLTQNGFAIPDAVKPVIAAYVNEKFDFLALKLVPGKGVNAMRPVRVTTQGASAVLPLRMVAAGTGAVVGITLWVVGEGRYEPQNFPSFAIKNEDLTWDWTTSSSDYKALRAKNTADRGGQAWEIENSQSGLRYQLQSIVQRIGQVNPSAGSDYAPVVENGQTVKTADQVRQEDLAALYAGIGNDRVTRMRADLPHAALAVDLALAASQDQSEIDNVRVPAKEKNQPICPVYDGCTQIGTAPRDEAIAHSSGSGGHETFSCAVSRSDQEMKAGTGASGLAALGGAFAFLGLAFVRARRARRDEINR